MKTARLFAFSALAFVAATTAVGSASAQQLPQPLQAWPSHAARKVNLTVARLQNTMKNRIDIKFVAGSGVRMKSGKFVIDNQRVVGRSRLAELAQVNALLQTGARRSVALRVHARPEAE